MAGQGTSWVGKRVALIGLGGAGRAVARYLLDQGATVVVNDTRSEKELEPSLEQLRRDVGSGFSQLELRLGSHDLQHFHQVDAVVVSPGVRALPLLHQLAQTGVPVLGELEWTLQELQTLGTALQYVAITGTNGKSTVTSLVGNALTQADAGTFVGGNLGRPFAEILYDQGSNGGAVRSVVLELSSFQLMRTRSLHAHVAALLNLNEDHLDWHASFEEYRASKMRIFRNQTGNDWAVLPSTPLDLGGAPVVGQRRTFGVESPSVEPSSVERLEVVCETDRIVDRVSGLELTHQEIPLLGSHNHQNVAAAMLIARLAGASPQDIRAGVLAYRGLPHRTVRVRELQGVTYYNDSKATNVHAAVASIRGLAVQNQGKPGLILIAGGKDKHGDYGPLRNAVAAHVRHVVLLGESAPVIEQVLQMGTQVPTHRAESLQHALHKARALALPGDRVVLAPACSSFDMFSSFARRGELFEQYVRDLAPASAERSPTVTSAKNIEVGDSQKSKEVFDEAG